LRTIPSIFRVKVLWLVVKFIVEQKYKII